MQQETLLMVFIGLASTINFGVLKKQIIKLYLGLDVHLLMNLPSALL
jgi:hypothetical protein